MSREVSSDKSCINNLNDQLLMIRAAEEEDFETIIREEKVIPTPNGEVQYHVAHVTNVTVQDRYRQGDIKNGTQLAAIK